MPGVEAQAEPVAIRLAPARLFSDGELSLERIEAKKIRITLAPARFAATAPGSAPAGPPAPFGGVLAALRLPLAWRVQAVDLGGRLLVREGLDLLARVNFALAGGGLAATSTGVFTYELTADSALLPASAAHPLRSHGTLRLSRDADHGVARLALAGDLILPPQGALVLPPAKFTLALAATPAGETYRAHLDFGAAGALDFSGALAADTQRITGRLELRGDDTLVARLLGDTAPRAALTLGADFTLDLRSGDLDVTLAGDLAAGDWARLRPELAVLETLRTHLTATLTRRAGRFVLTQAGAVTQASAAPLTLTAALAQPLDLAALPAGPLARLTLEHAPLAWANPWLAPAGVQLSPAEFGGAWDLVRTADRRWQLTPAQPCTTSPLTLQGARVPLIPPVRFTFSPTFTLGADRAALDVARCSVLSDNSDRIAARIAADYVFATHTLHAAGRIRGALPTLLSTAGAPVPFALVTAWDFTLADTQLAVQQLDFFARHRGVAEPFVSLQLRRPLALDLAQLRVAEAGAGDWLQLKFNGLPLGWLSRWRPGREIAGTIVAGESMLRSSADGRLTLESTVPWRVADASFALGGRTLFAGELGVAPGFALAADHIEADLAGLVARDRDGNHVTGRVTLEADRRDFRGSTSIEVDADLPRLPHSAETFGPLRATLRARSHSDDRTRASVDQFELHVHDAWRELLAITAPQPFRFGVSAAGNVSLSTPTPLQLTLDELPLAWLRPWLTHWEFEGTLQPCTLRLSAEQTQLRLRPIKPVQIRGFAARDRGRELARDTQLTLFPGLDLTVVCVPLPTFNLAYAGSAYLTDVALEVGGRRAMDLDLAASFDGDDRRLRATGIELTTRLDLAPLARLPAAIAAGLPARGTIVARLNGDLLGRAPLESWARLDSVPAADGQRTLPALELSALGRIDEDQHAFDAEITLLHATKPQPTDARFGGRINFRGDDLQVSSALRSRHFDAGAMLAVIEAFLPKSPGPAAAAPDPAAAAPARPRPAWRQPGVPLWTGIRGHFDLEIGTVQFGPYRLDRLQGRLEADDRALVLRNLSGEMFAGRFGGGLRVDYDPAATAGDHRLAAELRLEQFDSARVVQAALPNEVASLDARIDVTSSLASRGNSLPELVERCEGAFTVAGTQGVLRLHVPQGDTFATAAIFGGTVFLSPELRALGRLLRELAELPIERVAIAGRREATGEISLSEFHVDSPQARLAAHGRIAAVEGSPLLQHPLELSVDLAAKDEMAVILGSLHLIEPQPQPDGYRALKERFVIGGTAGQPDMRPLYDLLARGIVGSKGTWGYLLRKVQAELDQKAAPAHLPTPDR